MRLLFERLETKVIIKPANQTNEPCKLNYNQNLGDIYSISMVITQLNFILNGRTVKY